MPDLDTILQEFASFIEDELPPPDVERLISTAPVHPTERPRWRTVVVLVAAILTVLTIGAPLLVLGVFSSEPVAEDPLTTTTVPVTTTTVPVTTTTVPVTTTTVPVTTTTVPVTTTIASTVDAIQEEWMIEQGPAALALVEDYYSALNPKEIDQALARVSGLVLPESLHIAVEGLGATFITDCFVSDSRQHIVCNESVTDNLYGPAGIALKAQVGYRAGEGQVTRIVGEGYDIPACAGDPPGGAATYLLDLYAWTVETYPGLDRNFTGTLSMGRLGIPCTPYPFHSAESASEIADVVPEFVSQSDKYPRSTP